MSAYRISILKYSVFSSIICCALIIFYMMFYKKGKKIGFEDILFSCLLVIVSSVRYGVGSDYFRYLEATRQITNLYSSNLKDLLTSSILQHYGAGYKFLSYFSGKISRNPYCVFWIVSIIIYPPIVFYCRKHTNNPIAAISVFFLFGYWGLSLNALRQCIAMVMILYVEIALENRKYILAILLTMCAVAFHTTAIVAAVFIALTKIVLIEKFFEPTKRNLLKMIIIGLVLRTATELLSNVISRFANFAQYTKYLDTQLSERATRTYMMIGVLIEAVVVVIILYVAINKLEKTLQGNGRLSKLISIVMIGIPFSILGISRTDWLWLSNRFAEYFFIFLIVLIPEMICDSSIGTRRGVITIKKNRMLFWLSLIVCHALFAFALFNNNSFVIDTYLFK